MKGKSPKKPYREPLRNRLRKITETLNLYSNLISVLASIIVAVATIALAIITYFQINEAKLMRIETGRLVNTGIEQFKIKSYPNLSIVFRPLSYQSNSILQVYEIRNRGEITAFDVTNLLIQVYEKDSRRQFVNSWFYKEDGEERNGLRFTFTISPNETKIIEKQDFMPDEWTFDSLKGELLFIRFKVPYDNKYRYESNAYRIKRSVGAKEPAIVYRMGQMDSMDSDILIKEYMNSPSPIPDSTRNDIKRFFKDYDLEYK